MHSSRKGSTLSRVRSHLRAHRNRRQGRSCMPEVMAPTRGFFIDGQWSTSASVVDIHSPYDQKVVGSVAMAGEADVERAIAASVRAFDVTRKLAAYERQRVLKTVSKLIS